MNSLFKLIIIPFRFSVVANRREKILSIYLPLYGICLPYMHVSTAWKHTALFLLPPNILQESVV